MSQSEMRRGFVARLLATVVAVFVLWTPFATTVARAQDWRSPERAAEGVRERMDSDDRRQMAEDAEPSDPADTEPVEVDEEPTEGEAHEGEDLEPLSLPTGPSKTAVTPQSISLPKAEGSIQGMGESFSPNLSSGTGTYSVPISLPAGRKGVQPSLGLSYATSGGNGPLGFGWSMGAPFIMRQSDKGMPEYVDLATWHAREDKFMYNGGQELVPINGAAAAAREGAPVPSALAGYQQYRARVEGGFMRFFRAPDSTHWVVQSKDGTRFEFGVLPSGNNLSASEDGIQADPNDRTRIEAWHLVRMSDVHGSTVHYRYRHDRGQVYLEDIFYTSPDSCGALSSPDVVRACSASLADYAHRVHMVYESRQDTSASYTSGHRIETALRLKRIEVTSSQGEVGSRFLVRRYHLTYDANSYHSLLTSVQVEGRPSVWNAVLKVWVGDTTVGEEQLNDSIVGELLPPMQFAYTAPAATSGSIPGFGGIDATVLRAASSPPHSMDEGKSDFFDVNADGLPDLLVTDPARFDGGAGVFFNGFAGGLPGKAGEFSDGVRIDIPGGLSNVLDLGSVNVLPMDVDGDGRSDLLHMPRTRNYGYFVLSKAPTRAGQSYNPIQGWSFEHVTNLLPAGVTDPRIDLGADSPTIKTQDVNRDGLIDVLRSTGSVLQTWVNLGRYPGGEGRFGSATWNGAGWTLSTEPVESCLPITGRLLDFSDSHTRFADMNGDGLEDIVIAHPDRVVYLPGRGVGVWGDGDRACSASSRQNRHLTMANPPRQMNVNLSGVHFMDVNADGASDLVQVDFDRIHLWFNKLGQGFTERLSVSGVPRNNAALERVRVADIDGSGSADIVYGDASNYRWIDPMGGTRPRLLREVDNGLGALTTLSYGSSADDYLRDLAESRSCDPNDLDCFTWQREPRVEGAASGKCDAWISERGGPCVHRSMGSPVVSTVVRSIRTTDRLNVLGAEETVSESQYAYHDGYYEGIEQEFRGFGAADAVAIGDEHEPTSYARTHFHQGRRPNELGTDRLADNPNEALKGREFLTESFDQNGVYLNTSHATYHVRLLYEGLNGVAVSYAYVGASDEFRYDTAKKTGAQTPWGDVSLGSVVRELPGVGVNDSTLATPQSGDTAHTFVIRDQFYARIRTTIDKVDNLGHVLTQTKHGRGGRGEFGESVGDERIVEYATPMRVNDRACGDSGWLFRTQRTRLRGHDDGGLDLGATTHYFDSCGDETSTQQAATVPLAFDFSPTFTQSSTIVESSVALDAWGQPRVQCAGANIATAGRNACLRLGEVTYDPSYAKVVTEESAVSDGVGALARTLTTKATFDFGLGVVTRAEDPNGFESEVFYDGLGRVTSSIVPNVKGCEDTRVPTTRIQYELTANPAAKPVSRVRTTTLLSCLTPEHADSQIVSVAYVDGLGRPRAALTEGDSDPDAWEDGQNHPWTLSGRSLSTRKGKPWRAYQPRFFDGSPDDARAVLSQPNTPSSLVQYDAFGRPTAQMNEDQSFRSFSYHALSTDLCDEVDNGFGAPGMDEYRNTCTTQRVDGHGRAIDQELRQVTLEHEEEFHRLFTYYRADGAVLRLVRAKVPENTLRIEGDVPSSIPHVDRRFYYDSLGRRIASEDPDSDNPALALSSRTWRYLFNKVGDLVAVRDPRGCGQNFVYDRGGRLIGEQYVGCTEAQAGEVATHDAPANSVMMDFTSASTPVHVRYFFDEVPGWAASIAPEESLTSLGRATGVSDRAQRSAAAFDDRGHAIWAAKQMAVIPDEVALTSAVDADGRPLPSAEGAVANASTVFDTQHTYTRSAVFDHAGRTLNATLPADPDFAPGAPPVMKGSLTYYRNGAAKSASLSIDGASRPVIQRLTYTRDGLVARTRHGDPRQTTSTALYNARRQPVEFATTRSPTAGAAPESLGAVSVPVRQQFEWDGANNLFEIRDLRIAAQWPTGHKPYKQEIRHDALYRVGQVNYTYSTGNGNDSATNWRDDEDLHRANDPMRPKAAPMVSSQASGRIKTLSYRHDWLANMTSWHATPNAFYERGIGAIVNGNNLANGYRPASRPSALYLTTDLATAGFGTAGWLEADYGGGGNLVSMTVHGQCGHRTTGSCVDSPQSSLSTRRSDLRTRCSCASEQHYVYRWDELDRLHEARRYDRTNEAAWSLAARQRYRYDSANQRTVKQTLSVTDASHRAALYVYPGDYERRGLEADPDGDAWNALPDTETQYLIAGARVVWQNRNTVGTAVNPDQRVTFAVTNLIQSTSAVVDLLTGELIEASGYYPNGAREESLSASAQVPLEPAGFTGKEADEEVGLAYFGERYLVERIGRWATPDPLHVHATGGGEAGNSYHYISGNVLQARDPLGLEEGGGPVPDSEVGTLAADTTGDGMDDVVFYDFSGGQPTVNHDVPRAMELWQSGGSAGGGAPLPNGGGSSQTAPSGGLSPLAAPAPASGAGNSGAAPLTGAPGGTGRSPRPSTGVGDPGHGTGANFGVNGEGPRGGVFGGLCESNCIRDWIAGAGAAAASAAQAVKDAWDTVTGIGHIITEISEKGFGAVAGVIGGGGGKSRSSRPDPLLEADGRPHTIIERPGPDGQYTTHNGDGTYKQYRGSGQDHGGIPRPNIKENQLNIAPDGRAHPGRATVRPAHPDEIPGGGGPEL